MKHVVRKAFYDFEKEEKYLNEMSAKGLALTDYSWCRYVFEDAPKGKYIYRLELLENLPNHIESQNYIKFMEETGAEFVASYMRWVYFRRRAADGEFDIYSDMDSKIKHYKRILSLFSVVTGINLFAGLMNLVMGIRSILTGAHRGNLYLSFLSLTVTALLFFYIVLPLIKRIRLLSKDKEIVE